MGNEYAVATKLRGNTKKERKKKRILDQ